jgi:methionine sulfoxide reductase heme-binding subunit
MLAFQFAIILTWTNRLPMPTRLVPATKILLHLLFLAPFAYLLHLFQNGALGLLPDPVNYLTHFTGDWALWLLLADLAITPMRRLNPALSFLIRYRRMVGLYAFFYATLHLLTYVFLFSGYDIPTAFKGLKHGDFGQLWIQFKLVLPTMIGDIRKRSFIQVGLAAWVVLLLLAATSPAFMLRTMGGKNWQRLHRLIYIAAIAAVVHFFWLVKTGVRTPWKDGIVLAVLLFARVMYSAMKWRRVAVAGSPQSTGISFT